jgi:precorrin-2 methylase
LDGALEDPTCTVVVYKGGRHLPDVASRLRRHQRLEGAVVGEMLGLPGGRWVELASIDDQPASYLATVVVPAARADRP